MGPVDLSAEAIRLGRSLVELMPDEAEAHGLLALMPIGHARTAARFRGGELGLLDDQDRSLWDEGRIAEGRALLERELVLHGNGPGGPVPPPGGDRRPPPAGAARLGEDRVPPPAARARHRLAGRGDEPRDRGRELEGPEAGLALLDGLELDGYRYYHATRTDLLRRLGRVAEARAAYARALEATRPGPERRFLERRLASLPEGPGRRRLNGCPSRRRPFVARPAAGAAPDASPVPIHQEALIDATPLESYART